MWDYPLMSKSAIGGIILDHVQEQLKDDTVG